MKAPLARWVTDAERRRRELRLAAIALALGLILGLALAPRSAHADQVPRLELSAGAVRYGAEDGIWWDSFYPYAIARTANAQTLSVSVPGWRYSLVHLGRAVTAAQWGDQERSYELAHPDAPRRSAWIGTGTGQIAGLSVAKVYSVELGPVELGAEGGLLLYAGEWREKVRAIDCADLAAIDYTDHVNLTTFAGITARAGVLFAELRAYYQLQDGFINHGARSGTIGLAVPF